jgi:hypothetical protein
MKNEWVKGYVDRYVNHVNKSHYDSLDMLAKEKEPYLPKYLYKYYPANEFCISSIVNNDVYLSKPSDFNDPYDCFILKDDKLFIKKRMLRNVIARLVTEHGSEEQFSQKEFELLTYAPIVSRNFIYAGYKQSFESELRKILRFKSSEFQDYIESKMFGIYQEVISMTRELRVNSLKIACFSVFESESDFENQTVMWSHYAKNHTGVCVKYSLNDSVLPQLIGNIVKVGMYPVSYTSRVPLLSYSDFSSVILNKNGDHEFNNRTHRKLFKMVLTKSRFWSYEKEWRLVIDSNHSQSYQSMPFFKIDSIYLGCRMKSDMKLLYAKLAYDIDAKLFESHLADDRIGLNYFDISQKSLIIDDYYSQLCRINRLKDGIDKDYENNFLEEYHSLKKKTLK